MSSLGFRGSGFRYNVVIEAHGLVSSLGFRVQGLGFRVQVQCRD